MFSKEVFKMTDLSSEADLFGDTIEKIIAQYPYTEWLERSRYAFPDAYDDEIIAAIEILSGGDVIEIGDEDQ